METEDIYDWMANPENLIQADIDQLKDLVERYPYFQQTRLLYLKALYLAKHPDFEFEMKNSAAYVPDRVRFFYFLALKDNLWNEVFEQYAKEKSIAKPVTTADTVSMIDSFLQDYAPEILTQTPQLPTQKAARMAYATQDYAALLMSDDDTLPETETSDVTAPLKHQSLIDSFISFADTEGAIRQQFAELNADEAKPENPVREETTLLDEYDLLTESLAKIYIKQKRYYKAIEIIRKLSLKYPEKSVYFADQIRFLEKLITNIKKE